MLFLKLLIVPFFLAGVSMAACRWGPQVGGLLAGFPVVTGPILCFLLLEQGPQFAATAAQGSLLAVIACVAFGIAYSHGSLRLGWPFSVALGLSSWVATALVLSRLPPGLPLAAGLTFIALAAGPFLLPLGSDPAQPAQLLPRAELTARMVAGAALVIALTAAAETVGTRWAGLMAMFPVLGAVLGVFSHRRSGAMYVSRLFRGMFRGFYSFATFCISLSLLLKRLPATGAFTASVTLAMLVQAAVYWATAPNNSLKRTKQSFRD
jgi:uncharacterized membrane protein (GlpM family)